MKLQLYKILICLFLAFVLWPSKSFCQQEKKIEPPKKIFYDEKMLKYNPSWKDKEIYMETDLDGIAGDEIIISFLATFTPQSEIVDEKAADPLATPKKELLMLENYAFFQIYTKGPGNHWILAKTIRGMDQLGEIKLLTLDGKKQKAVAFLSPGGEHYTDLSVYQWQQGGYRLILNTGGSGPIEFDTQTAPPEIHISDGSKIEIWTWDNGSNNFK